MTINTIDIMRWEHVTSMGFFLGLFKGWNQKFKVKNSWNFIQNKMLIIVTCYWELMKSLGV
jgi:hypothetical protein